MACRAALALALAATAAGQIADVCLKVGGIINPSHTVCCAATCASRCGVRNCSDGWWTGMHNEDMPKEERAHMRDEQAHKCCEKAILERRHL